MKRRRSKASEGNIGNPLFPVNLVVFAGPELRQRVSDLRDELMESNLPFRVDLHVWDDVRKTFRARIAELHVEIQPAA